MKMNRIISWLLARQVAISMILALFGFALASALFPGQVKASQTAKFPEGMSFMQKQFGLVCASAEIIHRELRETHGEIPVVAGLLDGGTQYLLFINQNKTSMSFVIQKSEEESCIVWSGSSTTGQSFIMNPDLVFPEIKTST